MSKNRFSLNGDGRNSEPPSDDRDSQVKSELSRRYRDLAALWGVAEEHLLKYRIPVDVHFCYKVTDTDIDYPGGAQLRSFLGFVRYGRGWRICHCVNHDAYPEREFEWTPVVDCRLDVRLETVQYIDQLREAVVKAAEESIPKLDNALAKFRDKLTNW